MLDLGRNFMQAMPGRYCGFLLNKSDMTGDQAGLPPEMANSSVPAVRTSAKTGENIKRCLSRSSRRHSPSWTLKPT